MTPKRRGYIVAFAGLALAFVSCTSTTQSSRATNEGGESAGGHRIIVRSYLVASGTADECASGNPRHLPCLILAISNVGEKPVQVTAIEFQGTLGEKVPEVAVVAENGKALPANGVLTVPLGPFECGMPTDVVVTFRDDQGTYTKCIGLRLPSGLPPAVLENPECRLLPTPTKGPVFTPTRRRS